jgi:hypothetical protein
MSNVTNTYEVWTGEGDCHECADYDAADAKLRELEADGIFAKLKLVKSWPCDNCKRTVTNRGGRDESCECGAQYNSFGQRLRDDWRDNPSNYDENIGDLEGFEISQLRKEAQRGDY